MTHSTTFISSLSLVCFPHLFPTLHFACYFTSYAFSAILCRTGFQKETLQLLTVVNKVSPPNS